MSLFATAVEWASTFAADLASLFDAGMSDAGTFDGGMFDIGGSGIEIDGLDLGGAVPPIIGGGKPEEPEPPEDECDNMGTPGTPADAPSNVDFTPPSPGEWTLGGGDAGGTDGS